MTMQYGCSNSFQAASPGRAACGLTSCLQGTIPIHPRGSLIEIRCALLKREVQGKHCCIFVACLVASKIEPRTFGLGFVLVFFLFIYLFIFDYFGSCLLVSFVSSIRDSVFVSCFLLENFVDGWRTNRLRISEEPTDWQSLTNHKQTFLCKMRQLLKGYHKDAFY